MGWSPNSTRQTALSKSVCQEKPLLLAQNGRSRPLKGGRSDNPFRQVDSRSIPQLSRCRLLLPRNDQEFGPLITPSPLILATWSFALPGVERALTAFHQTGDPLDACESVCSLAEQDERVDSVGYGGLPDASGTMSLDAMVMRGPSESGAVCCVQRHLEVTRLARLVMECTPHMMLAGEAADRFASGQGIAESDLLAPSARSMWFDWSRSGRGLHRLPEVGLRPNDAGADAPGALFSITSPNSNDEERWKHHDTIGVLARSPDG